MKPEKIEKYRTEKDFTELSEMIMDERARITHISEKILKKAAVLLGDLGWYKRMETILSY